MSRDNASLATPQTKEKKRKHGERSDGKHSNKKRKTSEGAEQSIEITKEVGRLAHRAQSNGTNTKAKKSSHAEEHQLPEPRVDDIAKSPFRIQRTSFYLPISPIYQQQALDGLCAEHLSPLILTYYPPFNGIILSYSKPRMSNRPSRHKDVGEIVVADTIDEYGASYVWLTADFLILRPERGSEIEGHVSVQSQSHLGLICWNLFNAGISADHLPKDWRWTGGRRGKHSRTNNVEKSSANEEAAEEGYFVDGRGNKVEGKITFRVFDYESLPTFGKDKSFISIQGTLLSEKAEATYREELERRYRESGKSTLRSDTHSKSNSAVTLPVRNLSDVEDGVHIVED